MEIPGPPIPLAVTVRAWKLRARAVIAAITVAALVACLAPWSVSAAEDASTPAGLINFVFTSDAHYGLSRGSFRGRSNVDAQEVNQALVEIVNRLSDVMIPEDGGLGAGKPVGAIEFLAESGDIANRMELDNGRQIQTAATSFAQFQHDYVDGLTAADSRGTRTRVFAVPGNHDATNAVGFYRPMSPPIDPTSMIEMFNRMPGVHPTRTRETFQYRRDRVLFSQDVSGLHLIFIAVWPDSTARGWIANDLKHVPRTTPVVLFTHDQPDAEGKHFLNPRSPHDVNEKDRFENLLSDEFREGEIATASIAEQRGLEWLLHRYPNIAAYFHGNSNWNQFYDYVGPDHAASVHVFRVDSPMKGRFSASDESRLSFQLATYESLSKRLTVREVLWNADPRNHRPAFGASTTVSLRSRR